MSALAFVLGVLVGMTVLWLIYSVYWRRWRGYMLRDMTHLQAKVKSIEATNIGLERQMSTQKTDLAGMRSKINVLETENRLAQARIEGTEAEKRALSEHLNTLRAELMTYKSLAAESDLPLVQARTAPINGKKKDSIAAPFQSKNGEDKGQVDTQKALEGPLNNVIETPANSAVHVNGSAPKKALPANGKTAHHLVIDQFIEPEIVIARPRMSSDRLEIIQGVSPAVLKKLHQAGIDSFRTLAALGPDRLKDIVGLRHARLIDANRIIDQARKIVGDR